MSDPLKIICPSCDTANRVPEDKLGDRGKCGSGQRDQDTW